MLSKNAFKKTKKPFRIIAFVAPNPTKILTVRSHYQQLTEFQRGRIIGLREDGFSFFSFFFRDNAERLGRNVSTVHDCWEQWSRDGNASRTGSGRSRALLRGKTTVFSIRLWRLVLRLWQKFELHLEPQ
ncbi:uncharacterized protein TNCV_2957141 [Trichonephila clavipes]|nr:uncharacterized protein TNCV_2957141 [Trichonephila clavipes]